MKCALSDCLTLIAIYSLTVLEQFFNLFMWHDSSLIGRLKTLFNLLFYINSVHDLIPGRLFRRSSDCSDSLVFCRIHNSGKLLSRRPPPRPVSSLPPGQCYQSGGSCQKTPPAKAAPAVRPVYPASATSQHR